MKKQKVQAKIIIQKLCVIIECYYINYSEIADITLERRWNDVCR